MNIRLHDTKADSLSFSKVEEKREGIDFKYVLAFSEDEPKNFLIIFDLEIDVEENYIFSVKYISHFKTDKNIKKSDHDSKFFSINAPAIAYPFLRAYVANFLLSSGYDPIMLPTINFVKLDEESRKKNKPAELKAKPKSDKKISTKKSN